MSIRTLPPKQKSIATALDKLVVKIRQSDPVTSKISVLKNLRDELDEMRINHGVVIDSLFELEEGNDEETAAQEEKFNEIAATARRSILDKICEASDIKHAATALNEHENEIKMSINTMGINFQELEAIESRMNEAQAEPLSQDDARGMQQALSVINAEFKRASSHAINSSQGETLQKVKDEYLSFQQKHIKVWGWVETQAVSLIKSPSTTSTERSVSTKPKLPQITLPTFDGSSEKWIPFRDSFLTTIHNEASLSEIAKFRYLKMQIIDKMSPIAHLIESEDGYADAWQSVLNYYDDKRKIIDKHIGLMIATKKMTHESSEELQKLLNEFTNNTSSLLRLCNKSELCDAMIANHVSHRLDPHTRDLWETENTDEIPSWPKMQIFLERRRKILSASQPASKIHSKPSEIAKPVAKVELKPSATKLPWHATTNSFVSQSDNLKGCAMCSGKHRIFECENFISLNQSQRMQKINSMGLCTNCFGKHPINKCESKFSCRTCSQKHHSLLHPNQSLSPNAQQFRTVQSTCNSSLQVNNSFTLLSTAIIKIQDAFGNWQQVRALLDSGSDASFITKTAADALKLRKMPANIQANGFGEKSQTISNTVHTKIAAREGWFQKNLEFLVTNKITGIMPTNPFSIPVDEVPNHLLLADPYFNQPGKIDVLIGNELFLQLINCNRFELPCGPIMQDTVLGWIIAGKIKQTIPNRSVTCNVMRQSDLKETMEKFYKEEDYRTQKRFMTAEEQFCEQIFEQTHTRSETGRFSIQIPLKENANQLLNNRNAALCQFLSNERRLAKNDRLGDETIKFMREYEKLGHMTKIPTPQIEQDVYYMPHHAVEKPDSSTTKVRVVFNASSKTKSGLSFNDVQCVGPQIQSSSFQLGLKFRQHNVIIKADIEKMYRQIEVVPEQRKLQLILWRENPHEPINTYELNTVTYGTASASYQSTRCLKQVAIDSRKDFPKASHEIENSMYVDDLMTGEESVEAAVKLFKEIDLIVGSAQMKLRKLSSNIPQFLQSFPEEDCEKISNTTLKALGIKWNPQTDEIEFDIKPIDFTKITKRMVLSEISKIYDPDGLLGPVIFKLKLFMKKVWLTKVSWDEPLSEADTQEWTQIASTFIDLAKIRIPRHILLKTFASLQLHGCSDASEKGYAACVYVRTADSQGSIAVHLICAKSRLAPTAITSIARLELCGALILAHLMMQVEESMITKPHKKFCWTDSTIILHWLKKSPTQLQPFVANRVSEIQELSHDVQWCHIDGKDNPADIISRGTLPEEIIHLNKWWNGAEFFGKPEHEWPSSIMTLEPEEVAYSTEFRKVQTVTLNISSENTILKLVNSSSRLFEAKSKLSHICRFIYNLRAKKTNQPRRIGPIGVDDLRDAEITVIRLLQATEFQEEFKLLSTGKDALHHSKLKNLNPIWDEQLRVIRVGGRLTNGKHIHYDHKHPMILPKSHFASLIIQDVHERNMHAGENATMGLLKLNYWPFQSKSTIRKQLHKCVKCFRVKPRMNEQFMGQLPEARVTPAPTFYNTGVDYAGPYEIKAGYTRNSPMTKCYIALFVCLATKAIHLEIVSELTTKAFLAAFDRFTSRRGLSGNLYSDRGTNFVGASNELQELQKFLAQPSTQDQITRHLVQQGITWHFIPPRAPSHGGLWESGIKSMKYHLKRVVNDAHLHFEEFNTLTCRIEAQLNSRPLMPASDDPNDLTMLTAGHFMIGRPLVATPQKYVADLSRNYLQRWDRVVQAQQHFWQRWIQEYLHRLQTRTKNYKNVIDIRVGNIVMMEIENHPPMTWPLGRIIAIHPGKDGITRVATIKTATGTYERPTTKIAILPIQENDQQVRPQDVNDN